MWSRLSLVTAPASTPVSLAEAKAHLRVDATDEDALITLCIAKAVAAIDGPFGIGRCMITQTWLLSLDCFPDYEIRIPLGPVASVTTLKYLDTIGVEQTLSSSNYWVANKREPTIIVPGYGLMWPNHRPMPGSVKIEFVAGASAATDDLKAAVLLLIGHYFEHREAVTDDKSAVELPLGVQYILDRYRAGRVA